MSPLLLKRWSIKTKSLTLFGGYAVALCLVYVAFTIYLLRRETAAVHERLQQTARMLSTEVDAHLQAGQQHLLTVARLPGLVYGLRTFGEAKGTGPIAPWTTLHYLFFKSAVFTGGVFLVDPTGVVLWTEPPGRTALGTDLRQSSLNAAILGAATGNVSGALGPDRMFDRPHVTVSARIETPPRERAGTLVGIIDLTAPQFAARVQAISTAFGRFAVVVDQDGSVLAGTGGFRLLQPMPALDKDGDAPLLASASLTRAPWRVVAGQPQATALADIYQLQRLLLSLGVGLTLVVLAVGIPFVRGFLWSIESLTHSAETMARGNLAEPVRVGLRQDELATLANTFERMRGEVLRSRRALEQRLEEREELIRLKEEFLANVSHELRTPLNVIIGYTDTLLDQRLAPEHATVLQSIRAQSEHLYVLLRDLMTLSGLSTGRIALEVGSVNVAEVLERLKPLIDELRQGTDVAVAWDCPESLPTIKTDALRLEQVLANLVTNAFKFTPHGTIIIRARHNVAQESVVFEVVDTGIGIPADEMPHIFDEFRQVDGSMHRRYGGIGLGLALVRKLTGLLQGDVAVASRIDEGSTFSVIIPTHLTPAIAPTAAHK